MSIVRVHLGGGQYAELEPDRYEPDRSLVEDGPGDRDDAGDYSVERECERCGFRTHSRNAYWDHRLSHAPITLGPPTDGASS